jgi:hypothetical protein
MNFVHELNIWIRSNGGGTEVKRQGYKVTGLTRVYLFVILY